MVASLGMYDGPGAQAANDRLWYLIARRLRHDGIQDIPVALDRGRPLDAIWSDPNLLFAQCCGYPLMTRYKGRLRVIATPVYRVTGCEGGQYRSRIIVRRDDPARDLTDLRGRRAAINDDHSNSGMNLFRAAVAPFAEGRRFFKDVIPTGSHSESIAAVVNGAADVAAIDAVSFAHAERDLARLTVRTRTIAWTTATPGLPFVTAGTAPDTIVAALRTSLVAVLADPSAADVIDALLLSDLTFDLDYRRIVDLQQGAVDASYPVLS